MKNTLRHRFAYILFMALFFSCANRMNTFEAGECTPTVFKLKLGKTKGILVDVRTPEEFNTMRIPGAININLFNPDFNNVLDTLNRKKSYFLYCGSGKRSKTAWETMRSKGFRKVYTLKGGIEQWEKEGFPVAGHDEKRI
jgi:rhodanese-related sulfurtransferase